MNPENPAPYELVLYSQCKKWGVLPVSGGILAQPSCLMKDFEAIEDAIKLWELQQPPEKPTKAKMVDMTRPT